jgi:hypothetical protein
LRIYDVCLNYLNYLISVGAGFLEYIKFDVKIT